MHHHRRSRQPLAPAIAELLARLRATTPKFEKHLKLRHRAMLMVG